MWRWVSERLDDLIFPLLKRAHPGYARRMPPYCPCDEECDLLVLKDLPPPRGVEVTPLRESGGVRSYAFRFESGVECDCPENRVVTGRLHEVNEGAPWVVIIPGFATGALHTGYGPFERSHARAVLRSGMNAALLDLPYHLGRRKQGSFSGEPFFSPDLRRSVRTLFQSAADGLGLCRWLSSQGPVGVWGTSLGGCVAGLTAVLTDQLNGVVLMEPLDNAGDVLRQMQAAGEIRGALARAGIDPGDITDTFRPVSPSAYRPAIPRERLLFIIPAYDRIVPTSLQERFWRSWGEPDRLLLRDSHVTAVANGAAVQAAVRFLADRLLPLAAQGEEEGNSASI